MTPQHTPGPWHVSGYHIDAPTGTVATVCDTGDDDSQGLSNARLIAKAPDLRDALQNLLTAIHNRENNPGFASAGNYVRALERARALLED